MAARFQTTVYNEKGRKIVVAIKDNVFSGMTYDFDTIGLQLQYDSESQQGQERFTPIIGSRCSLSLLINNSDLETLLLDIGLAVEGRFTMELTAYEDDNTTTNICNRWIRMAKDIRLQECGWALQRAGHSCSTYFKLS